MLKSNRTLLNAIAGGELDMGSLRDSFKIAHASYVILLLQSNNIIKGEHRLDQLDLLAKKHPEKQQELDRLRSLNRYNIAPVY
jgi:hypothetical protein